MRSDFSLNNNVDAISTVGRTVLSVPGTRYYFSCFVLYIWYDNLQVCSDVSLLTCHDMKLHELYSCSSCSRQQIVRSAMVANATLVCIRAYVMTVHTFPLTGGWSGVVDAFRFFV